MSISLKANLVRAADETSMTVRAADETSVTARMSAARSDHRRPTLR